MTEEEDIGDVQMLFVYGGEGNSIPIHCMTNKEMPDTVQGDWFEGVTKVVKEKRAETILWVHHLVQVIRNCSMELSWFFLLYLMSVRCCYKGIIVHLYFDVLGEPSGGEPEPVGEPVRWARRSTSG